MPNLLFSHKGYQRTLNGSVAVDRTSAHGAGLQAFYCFTGGVTKARNYAGPANSLTLQANASQGVSPGGRCYIGINSATSYATTGTSAAAFGITGSNRRTIFVRFRANAGSSPTNIGGLFSYGDTTGSNSLITVQQVSDSPSNNTADSWCVNYGSGKLYFVVPNTAGRSHSIVLTYILNSLQIYVDGNQVGLFAGTLTTTAAPNFDVGRWFISTPTDVAINYFNGSIFMLGVVNFDWTPRQVRQWHENPTHILRNRVSMLASPGLSFVPNVVLTGIVAPGAVGVPTTQALSSNAVLSGIAAPGGVGSPFLALTTSLQFVSAIGIPAPGDVGQPNVARAAGWVPTPPAQAGTVTPVPSS